MDFTPKTLPKNLEAEQAVLAAVLMNNRALERVSEFLKPEHFSHPAHQEIYKLAERQFSAGIPFDLITAKNYLDQQGVLESVGGLIIWHNYQVRVQRLLMLNNMDVLFTNMHCDVI